MRVGPRCVSLLMILGVGACSDAGNMGNPTVLSGTGDAGAEATATPAPTASGSHPEAFLRRSVIFLHFARIPIRATLFRLNYLSPPGR